MTADESQCQKKVLWLLPSFRWYVWGMSLKLLDYTSRHIVVETWVKNCATTFYNDNIGIRSYLLKSNFNFNLQKYHFVCVYEVIIKCYLNFITCLYSPLVLIRWNSSHCHLMELFKSKESYKEKFGLNNNWKTAWPGMILEWHLFLRLSLGFVWKMLSFIGKHLSFTQIMSVHFLYFLFKWKGPSQKN